MKLALVTLALSLAASLLAPFGCDFADLRASESAEVSQPERIVLIVVDTLRRDHVSVYGDRVPTPNVDALARRGQVFARAFSAYHQTTMSMSALFTGRTPSIERGSARARLDWTGETWCGLARLNHRDASPHCIPETVPTLAESMHGAGYWTIGVSSNKLLYRPGGYERGFDRWVEIPGVPVAAGSVNHAVAEQLRDRPVDRFFLYVHYMDVHDYILRRERYASGVRTMDEAVGRLISMLESHGLMDGTAIVFTSDHGEHLPGEQHFVPANRGHSGSPSFDSLVRVPLIVAPPFFEGTDVHVRGDDVHRMLLSMAGIESESSRDLLPGELYLSEREFQTYRKGAWKSYRHRRTGRHLLVSLRSDPGETKSIAALHPDVVEAHAARMDALAARLGAPTAARSRLSKSDRERLRALGYLESE